MATADALAPVVHHPAALDRGANLATSEVIARTLQIREVMEKVMKRDVHYGVIPGTQKPTMYQPGADVLAVTFRIAPKVDQIDDLSTADSVRYRVRVQGVHQITGELLAEGVGECSSDEEKYRWRKPVVDDEWKETAEDRRREKWAKGQGGKPYKQKQIRTSPADVANTVLKMAVKRGKIAMILNATAASDVFAQDLEDLSEELRESLAGEDHPTTAAVPQPQRKSDTAPPASSQPPAATGTPATPAAAAGPPAGVLVRSLERRVSPSGTHFWIVTGDRKADDYYLLPERGEEWSAMLDLLRRLEAEQRRAEFDLEQPPGQKYPSIIGILPVGAAS